MAERRSNPWKWSTLVLTAVLGAVLMGQTIPEAEAAGPARLTKALAALKASKKFLDEAKEPPAPFHAQSLAVVGQAIAAVEREIKAYEAAAGKAKPDGSSKPAGKKKDGKDGKEKDEKAAKKKPSHAADEGSDE
jgi:hypothetical protein